MVGTTSPAPKKQRMKLSRADRVFLTLNDTLLVVVFLIVVYPLIYIVSSSFSSTDAVSAGRVFLWPIEPSTAGYRAVFENRNIMTGYANTIFYAVAGTLVNVAVTVLASYPLSRRDFKYRRPILFFFTFTMFFSGGIIPLYILVNNMGIMNTRWALILPTAMNVYNMIIAKTFFENSIPAELLEASRVDGCSDVRFLISVVLPLSKALLAVLTLFYAVFHWNAFFNALIFLSDRSKFPLQIVLREILILNEISLDANVDLSELEAKQGMRELLKYSSIVVASAPVLMFYPFIQKYFVKGVMIGSIKG
jgi:multiple sugar transport system permease protein/putative aldouronate transport system permease protein